MAASKETKSQETWLITYQYYCSPSSERITSTKIIQQHPSRWLLEQYQQAASKKVQNKAYICVEGLLLAIPIKDSDLTAIEIAELKRLISHESENHQEQKVKINVDEKEAEKRKMETEAASLARFLEKKLEVNPKYKEEFQTRLEQQRLERSPCLTALPYRAIARCCCPFFFDSVSYVLCCRRHHERQPLLTKGLQMAKAELLSAIESGDKIVKMIRWSQHWGWIWFDSKGGIWLHGHRMKSLGIELVATAFSFDTPTHEWEIAETEEQDLVLMTVPDMLHWTHRTTMIFRGQDIHKAIEEKQETVACQLPLCFDDPRPETVTFPQMALSGPNLHEAFNPSFEFSYSPNQFADGLGPMKEDCKGKIQDMSSCCLIHPEKTDDWFLICGHDGLYTIWFIPLQDLLIQPDAFQDEVFVQDVL